ncbi:MAG: putative 7-carboxy-7-deazaguanine synthase QueE [Lachnospiraceae bacterium]|nr:putative 7-carboxy-7-deazaguanine synthase QueE [Lachnospiraceae bacterium]MDE6252390.1 putative 7-carboxy-7-deazaguanine synthase QueE [Lachnospiraceae bacterium]
MEYKVAEKFVSINGEGTHSGQLAVFIRFCGCNLNCTFCDTKWVNEDDAEYLLMDEMQICGYIMESGIKNVTLTGGEPLMQPGIHNLIQMLTDKGLYVEIETNGSVPIKEYKNIVPLPSFTLDYKLPGSGMEKYMDTENFNYVSHNDTIKFVAGDMKDLEKFREIIDKYNLVDKCNVYLSPVFGRIEPEKMVEYMKEYRLNGVNMQLQMHKIIWSPDKRGV